MQSELCVPVTGPLQREMSPSPAPAGMEQSLTADHQQAQAELFHEYNVSYLLTFTPLTFHTDTFLTCHILGFAGETLGRLF